MVYYDKRTAKILSSILMVIFAGVLMLVLIPYMVGFIGAILFSVIFLPIYRYIVKLIGLPKVSAFLVIFLSIFIIVAPISAITPLLFNQLNEVLLNETTISDLIQELDNKLTILNIGRYVPDISQKLAQLIQWIFSSVINSATTVIINLVIAFFTMFYILINHKTLVKFILDVIPFSKQNNKKLIQNFKDITFSTLLSTILIALFQSVFLGLTFYLLGIEGALIWAVISFILALFPLVGIPLVWIPAAIILFIQGLLFESIVITVVGLILSNVDIFIRSWLQNKFGEIHPLITLVGVIVGIPFFGILGIFIGPILISYFLLMANMYKEEYLQN